MSVYNPDGSGNVHNPQIMGGKAKVAKAGKAAGNGTVGKARKTVTVKKTAGKNKSVTTGKTTTKAAKPGAGTTRGMGKGGMSFKQNND